jgi:tRNA(Ile)-lysidine synthase
MESNPTVDWRRKAEELARAVVPRWRSEHDSFSCAIDGCEPVAVACSGGADSLCLLLLLWAGNPQAREQMLVLHFDHRLRGKESEGDATFVAHVASALGLGCICGSWKEASPNADEDEAREARMAFLHRHASRIYFGHNRTDVAETMLMRLGRGASLEGLSGPRPTQTFIQRPGLVHHRPLIDISGAAIRSALRDAGIPWREDATNKGDAYARNRLRNNILPLLDEALGRDWQAGAARSRQRMEEAADLIDSLAAPHVGTPGSPLEAAALRELHPAVRRRALELWLSAAGIREAVRPQAMDAILKAICEGKATRHFAGGRLILKGEVLRLRDMTLALPAASWAPVRLVIGTTQTLPDGAAIRTSLRTLAPGEAALAISRMKTDGNNLSALLLVPESAVLEIRPRVPGDAYHPLGAPGANKVSKMLINRKIDKRERDTLPIVLVEAALRGVLCSHLQKDSESRNTQGRLFF